MQQVNLLGSLPGTIMENTASWGWFGSLNLTFDPALIRYVDLEGPGSSFFDVALNRHLGTLLVNPLARIDYEGLGLVGLGADLSFRIRFFMADGTVALSAAEYTVRVQDVDDTPPQALSFATGGRVLAGATGAVIGTLAVTDPDTVSGFSFHVRGDEAWLFEFVGRQLRLKPGMMLSAYDGPIRSLFVEVSDGRQSAGFDLRIEVATGAVPGQPLANLLLPGEVSKGFFWLGKTLIGQWSKSDLALVRDYSTAIRFTLRSGEEVWAEKTGIIDLIDSRIVFDAKSKEARVWNLYHALMKEEPGGAVIGFMSDAFYHSWYKEVDWVRDMLVMPAFQAKYGTLSNRQFVELLYRNTIDWRDPNGENYHTARLDAGLSREQLVIDFGNWRDATGFVAKRAALGITQDRPRATQADTIMRLGADIPPDQLYRDWYMKIFFGQASLRDLAEWTVAQPGFAAKWGGAHPWAFVEGFFREAGASIMTEQISWYTWEIAYGRMDKAGFLADASGWVANPLSGSYASLKPVSDFML
ncbi:DUF4214 domain-containing protein [Sabulicella glaciei]|uniref:DUF4214 domain-containing protein n=1 Tax=Sabulicella glaciei TaxID=2984948 RepID=A0ABT3NVE1_9PROT|nr:DUF4214 domain-containing protein [Roseococcus sp. MDT2-1-1]MCW8086119.1 DUF4214 domain-containing protein [Roseococcus sp. MDT2-1-1]